MNLIKIVVIISLILMIHKSLKAKDIILISYSKNVQKALLIKKILITDFEIPKGFISVQFTFSNCEQSEENSLLHLCLTENESLKIQHADENFLSKIIPLFLRKKGL